MIHIERLENRRLLSVTPHHIELAEQMIANIPDSKNGYTNGTPVVRFKGVDGATDWYNNSDCSSYITALMQASYGYTNQQYINWTGEADPEAVDYYNAAINNRGFDGFTNIKNVVPGDLLIIKYTDSKDTGHMVTIADTPTFDGTSGQENIYTLHVIDCTGSPHNPGDSRTGSEEGVGDGYMRLYTNLSGKITRYSWNNYVNGSTYDTTKYIPTFAHIPDKTVATPTKLAASSVTMTQVKLKWNDNSGIETGYQIERRLSSATSWSIIGTAAKNAESYTDKTVQPGKTYVYRVRAMFFQFKSDASTTVKVSIPAAISHAVVTSSITSLTTSSVADQLGL